MPKQLLLIISFFSSLVSIAGDGAYNVSYITEALLKNAGVVKRMELIEFEISESNSATLRHKVAYTILNVQSKNGGNAIGFSGQRCNDGCCKCRYG